MSRTAIVTGAARGIGAAIAAELLLTGHQVWCWDVDEAALAERVAELGRSAPGRVHGHVCDIRSRSSVQEAVAAVRAATPVVHVLVNNAFRWAPSGELTAVADDRFHADLDLLLLGPQRVTAETRDLLDAGSSIVTIASVHGFTANPHWGTYDIGKAALIQWARVTAAELGPHGITSNVVAPGIIANEPYADEELHRRHVATGLVPRLGEPADIARVVAFLADPRNGYLTGAVIPVDGGMTTRLSLTVAEGLVDDPAVSKGNY